MARAKRTRALAALVEAATDSLSAIEDPDLRQQVEEALKPYSLSDLRSSIAWADREDAQRAAAEAKVAEGERRLAELPDAPPRMQCEAHVARDQGRWTEFGRCEKQATRIVMDYDAKRERVACTIHAKEFVTTGKAGTGWDVIGTHRSSPTRESWYRIKGWCMAPDPRPDPRKPQRFCRIKVETGNGRHDGKEHKFQ